MRKLKHRGFKLLAQGHKAIRSCRQDVGPELMVLTTVPPSHPLKDMWLDSAMFPLGQHCSAWLGTDAEGHCSVTFSESNCCIRMYF